MKQLLNSKVAFVTGGSRGIGLAIARALAAQGVQVAVTGKSQSHLSEARPKIEAAGPARVETLVADVRNYADVERAINATVSRFGGLDFVINNAGVGIFANVADMTPAAVVRGHRHEPHRRLSTCATRRIPHLRAARRRLHHQHQQPGREERLYDGRGATARRNPG